MAGSTIAYNGITVHDVLLQTMDQTPEYDSTGVDPIYIKTVLTCSGVIHLEQSNAAAPDLGVKVGQLGDMNSQILSALTKPRREFRFYFGSTSNTLFHVVPSAVKPTASIPSSQSAHEDLNHGPKPQVIINRIRGDRSAMVTFRIELATWDCGEGGSNGHVDGVTNLRYWAIDDIDENWATTRTIKGKLRVKNKDIDLHALRGYTIPPIQGGFRRTKMHFAEASNGLELDFEIVDVEEHASPPQPATKWSARYDVTTNNGAYAICGVQVQLEGPPRGSRKDLLYLAMKIIDAKLDVLSRNKKNGNAEPVVIEHASFSEQLESNKVQAVMRIKKMPKVEGEFKLFNIVGETLGDPLPASVQADESYDHRIFLKPDPKAPLAGLLYSALQDPCDPDTMSTYQVGVEPTVDNGTSATETTDEDGDLGPQAESDLNHLEASSVYTDYKMSSDYNEHAGYGSMPVAKTSSSSVDPFVFRMHMGMPTRTVIVEAERIGKPPTVPKPSPSFLDGNHGIQHSLKYYHLSAVTPKLSPDGVSYIYRVRMEISWYLGKRIDPDNALYWAGSFPYDNSTLQATLLPASMFSDPSTGNGVQ